MAFPKPVPSLSESEIAYFRQQMDEFELPEGMEADLEKHREAYDSDE